MSQFIYGFLAAIVIPIVVLFSAGYFGLIEQIKPLVVQSGSMEPSIKTGSVVFTQKSPNYKQGDVITFSPENDKSLITHRIFSFDGTYFQTKGDANEEADFWKIKPDQIKGKVVLYIPYLGYGVDFVKQPKGFIFLVIIPATIIIYEELKTIKAEIAKLFLRFRPVASAGGAPKLMVIFPLFGLGLLLVTFTGSFFLDKEEALNNIFAAASSFSSPTPTPSPTPSTSPSPTPSPSPTAIPALVINEVSSDGNPNLEWVEIYNPTGSSVDVSGWKIEDGITDDVLPSASPIPANGYAVILGNASTVSVPSSAVTITLGNSTIGSGLNNPGDLVRLRTPTSTTVDEMNYGNISTVFPSPPPAPNAGQSVARIPNGTDTNSASDWSLDTTPTIGTANSL